MKLIYLILLFTVVTINVAFADADQTDESWMLLTGYGATHPGLGKTREHVETVDVILRYRRKLKDIGRDWYSWRHDFLIELPVSHLIKPDDGQILGLNFLASWTLKTSQRYMPYFFVGGGPVYTEANIPGMGANLCGNYQAGLGLSYKTRKGRSFVLEYRFHHISNAGMKQPNVPLNSSKVLVGINFSF
ncbi:acyloxyacyl hydrolase [bacterium]|nr:acyloxyacyl hydrolase [bacterium]